MRLDINIRPRRDYESIVRFWRDAQARPISCQISYLPSMRAHRIASESDIAVNEGLRPLLGEH